VEDYACRIVWEDLDVGFWEDIASEMNQERQIWRICPKKGTPGEQKYEREVRAEGVAWNEIRERDSEYLSIWEILSSSNANDIALPSNSLRALC